MAEKIIKPEHGDKEFSISETIDLLKRKFNSDPGFLLNLQSSLKDNDVRVFRPKNLTDKFVTQQSQWYSDNLMPLYDKELKLFLTLRMGSHVHLRAYLYACRLNFSQEDWNSKSISEIEGLADRWTAEGKGWYVTGGNLSLVKSFNYKGNKQEEEIFDEYRPITDI